MTKTEIKLFCIEQANLKSISSTEASYIIDKAEAMFNWIVEGVEFCPHCGEEGLCEDLGDDGSLN